MELLRSYPSMPSVRKELQREQWKEIRSMHHTPIKIRKTPTKIPPLQSKSFSTQHYLRECNVVVICLGGLKLVTTALKGSATCVYFSFCPRGHSIVQIFKQGALSFMWDLITWGTWNLIILAGRFLFQNMGIHAFTCVAASGTLQVSDNADSWCNFLSLTLFTHGHQL